MFNFASLPKCCERILIGCKSQTLPLAQQGFPDSNRIYPFAGSSIDVQMSSFLICSYTQKWILLSPTLARGKTLRITVCKLFISHKSRNKMPGKRQFRNACAINICIYVSIYSRSATTLTCHVKGGGTLPTLPSPCCHNYSAKDRDCSSLGNNLNSATLVVGSADLDLHWMFNVRKVDDTLSLSREDMISVVWTT